MSNGKTACIQRGYFSRAEAEACQRRAGHGYEVKFEGGAVYAGGRPVYRVSPKPTSLGVTDYVGQFFNFFHKFR